MNDARYIVLRFLMTRLPLFSLTGALLAVLNITALIVKLQNFKRAKDPCRICNFHWLRFYAFHRSLLALVLGAFLLSGLRDKTTLEIRPPAVPYRALESAWTSFCGSRQCWVFSFLCYLMRKRLVFSAHLSLHLCAPVLSGFCMVLLSALTVF